MGGRGDKIGLENRWWVDQQRAADGTPIERPKALFGHRFFRTGDGYDQDRAQRRLTDLNLKWFDEAPGPPGEWVVLRVLERERFNDKRLDRIRQAIVLPPDCRGVLADSGSAVRAIASRLPIGERLIELRLGEHCAFDAWVRSEWVREAFFRNFDDALRRAPALVREYLTTERAASIL